jgi:3-hydroxyisobutyrate dehydrogenase-like beta-hydroxyacid dehydrogenase
VSAAADSRRVSVLGLGLMGSAIATRLIDAGHEVAVWNRTASATEPYAERGAGALARPSDAWAHGDMAITMLADTAAVEATLTGRDGLLCGVGAGGGTIIDMSTISADGSARLAERATEANIEFLRAPVTGNPSVVAAGNLGIIISGPRETYAAAESVLRDIGPNHVYVGEGERARVAKLAVNLMLGGTTQLLAEAIVMAERNAIAPETMLEVIAGSAIGSPFIKYKTAGIVADDYTTTFTTSGLHKDLALALECASGVGVPMPVTALVQHLVQRCIASGMADLDFTALLLRLRQAAKPSSRTVPRDDC